MRRQLQGISLLLFGILLVITAAVLMAMGFELAGVGLLIVLPGGLLCGIIGLVFCLRKK